MADDARALRPRSPYSRTGLFPWGATYEVPALGRGDHWASQTPCHLRAVRLPTHVAPAGDVPAQRVRCVVCGRRWTVDVHVDRSPPVAVWTA